MFCYLWNCLHSLVQMHSYNTTCFSSSLQKDSLEVKFLGSDVEYDGGKWNLQSKLLGILCVCS